MAPSYSVTPSRRSFQDFKAIKTTFLKKIIVEFTKHRKTHLTVRARIKPREHSIQDIKAIKTICKIIGGNLKFGVRCARGEGTRNLNVIIVVLEYDFSALANRCRHNRVLVQGGGPHPCKLSELEFLRLHKSFTSFFF